ncbi:MAG: hypothetical protein HYR97_04675 [Candidatus Melainabacteria bacterium]|nr:hypothetical protein [Candidatus Melainabacteria bacterium]
MKVVLKNQKLETIPCDALIVNLFEGTKTLTGATAAIDNLLNGLLKKVIKEEEFKGKLSSTLVIRAGGKSKTKKVIVIGLGEKGKLNLDAMRKAYASGLRAAHREKAKTICTVLHGTGSGKVKAKDAAQAIAEISNLALYKFNKYKSKDKTSKNSEVTTVIISETNTTNKKDAQEGITLGNATSKAQILARDLVTEPPLAATPTRLANVARKIAKENKLKIKVLNKSQCQKLKMGAFLAVAQGSDEPPQFIECQAEKHTGLVM